MTWCTVTKIFCTSPHKLTTVPFPFSNICTLAHWLCVCRPAHPWYTANWHGKVTHFLKSLIWTLFSVWNNEVRGQNMTSYSLQCDIWNITYAVANKFWDINGSRLCLSNRHIRPGNFLPATWCQTQGQFPKCWICGGRETTDMSKKNYHHVHDHTESTNTFIFNNVAVFYLYNAVACYTTNNTSMLLCCAHISIALWFQLVWSHMQ